MKKTEKPDHIKAMEYIKASKQLRCRNCNAGYLRLRKVKCPFCGSKDIIDETPKK